MERFFAVWILIGFVTGNGCHFVSGRDRELLPFSMLIGCACGLFWAFMDSLFFRGA